MVEENAAFFAGMTGMHRYDGVDDNRDNSMDWADNYTSTFANLPSLSYASSLFDVQDHNYAASLYSPGLQWTPTNDFDVGNYTEHPFTGTQVLGFFAECLLRKFSRPGAETYEHGVDILPKPTFNARLWFWLNHEPQHVVVNACTLFK
ncbi:hypothetical protein BN1723_010364 [Verticillium longisporum]|uniref:Transcription factor n=2 Tax=Verticillium TaxID=1036719 RepID=G2X3D0_VERDV|nr:transcription factor [Verticillium dahliae VdLs.17]EGY23477.1 transcription factor [Verticillium dahliae VdLs.17]KAH6708502.1 transcription factor [Verticillium dahliae]CRK14529.1 hypothetical protein BN1723_010364 [Verticillium longisporum]CRK15984.1 hypothetical protein BN1708_011615 [Verticillium longisporum]